MVYDRLAAPCTIHIASHKYCTPKPVPPTLNSLRTFIISPSRKGFLRLYTMVLEQRTKLALNRTLYHLPTYYQPAYIYIQGHDIYHLILESNCMPSKALFRKVDFFVFFVFFYFFPDHRIAFRMGERSCIYIVCQTANTNLFQFKKRRKE